MLDWGGAVHSYKHYISSPIRYSPQTSICVYRANDSDYSLASGANNKGVFDIFRSQVYDPVGGRNIANNYVEVGPCDVSCEGHMMIT